MRSARSWLQANESPVNNQVPSSRNTTEPLVWPGVGIV